MRRARPRPGFTPRTTILALLTALVCAGASWTFDAGRVLAPQPADLWTPLSATIGSTAPAYVVAQFPSTVLLWPASWQSGSVAVGTPCSTYGLPPGTRATKRIEGSGSLRRCVKFDTTKPPPANAVRPLPPMPVVTGTDNNQYSDAIAATAVENVTVISWPAEWQSNSEANGPYAGQPCSDFPLLAGETTYKHIQSLAGNGSSEGPFRCVRIQDPIIFPGP
jgi:hypothetical protein